MASIKLPKVKFNLQKLDPIEAMKRLGIIPERKKWNKHGPMKIGFFTDTYLPNVDGVVNSILAYTGELERRGEKVFIFTSGTEREAREFANDKTFYFESVVFPPYPQYKLAVFPFNSLKRARESGIHLVHTHAIASMGVAAIGCAKTLNLPLVGTFHTMVPKATSYITKSSLGKKFFAEVAWKGIKQFYAPFDLVTAPSRTIEKLLNKHGVHRTAVVPNGIDTKKFTPYHDRHIVRKLLGISAKERVILTSGRLSSEKNVEVLLDAFARLRRHHKAKFIVQGDGPARLGYIKHAKKIGIQKDVIFTGFVKDYEIPFFYAAADVFATASTFETQGLALLEAMACERVCVGARSLAIPELIKHGSNGYLFRPFDARDCEEQLLKALELKDSQKKKLLKNARNTAVEYSIQKSTEKLVEAYKRVL